MKTINEESNKPKLLVVGETIEVLGLDLIIETELYNCEGCIFHVSEIFNPLCNQVDCSSNKCIISRNIK